MSGLVGRYIVPPIAIAASLFAVQYFANVTRREDEPEYSLAIVFGSPISWLMILAWLLGNAALLMIPFDKYNGQRTKFGTTPEYTDNCPGCYMTLIGSYLGFHSMWWFQSVYLYENYQHIFGNLFLVSLLLSAYVWYQGKKMPQSKEKLEPAPFLYELCRGVELHPRILNGTVDVKQWAVARVSFISWQIFASAFFFCAYQIHGFNLGFLCTVVLQTIFMSSLIFREKSLLSSTDIVQRRPGFYLFFEAFCFVPAIQSFSSYYFVDHLPDTSFLSNLVIFFAGLGCCRLMSYVYAQKELFKASNGNCNIWGRKAKYVEDAQEPQDGQLKPRLLVSGYWGLVRHPNYVIEMACAVCWALPGINLGIYPFVYSIYQLVVLVPRIRKNEAKCAEKYGPLWQKYCETVKYKLIPYIF